MAGEGRFGLNIDAVYVLTDAGPVPLLEYLEEHAGGDAVTWATLTGKPAEFPPAAHSHAVGDVTGLQTALDGKQAAGDYAAADHAHAVADVDGLQSALDGKQATGDYATASAVSDVAGRVATLESADVVTRSEFDALVARVDALEV